MSLLFALLCTGGRSGYVGGTLLTHDGQREASSLG